MQWKTDLIRFRLKRIPCVCDNSIFSVRRCWKNYSDFTSSEKMWSSHDGESSFRYLFISYLFHFLFKTAQSTQISSDLVQLNWVLNIIWVLVLWYHWPLHIEEQVAVLPDVTWSLWPAEFSDAGIIAFQPFGSTDITDMTDVVPYKTEYDA